jgi:glycerol-3-phosphate O-acyltransferase
VIRLGEPIDLFGNKVDDEGVSHDRRGRVVDPASYVKDASGKVAIDPRRDAQYTRELGEEICKSYAQNTVIMATHLVAASCFEKLRQASPAADLFTVLRQRDTLTIPRDALAADVAARRDHLVALERAGEIRCADNIRTASGGDIVESALRAFAGYHSAPVLRSKPDGICLSDTNLLFYYQNRLAAHGLAWDVIAPTGAPPTRPLAGKGPAADGGAE